MTDSNLAPISPTQGAGDDEIDLGQLVAALQRRWLWIAGGAAIGGLLAGLSVLTTKPTYQGEFQIVLQQPQGSSGGAAALLSANPGLAALAGLGGKSGSDSIATEIAILNSPSVLLPVFEAIKAQKPPEQASRMRFQQWAESAITVENEKGTSVLNVEFRDTDEALVLPITRKLSEIYQSYSNRGRSRELANVIAYLQEQIAQIKPQADTSARAALRYGYQHGLGVVDGLPIAGNVAGAGISRDGGGGGGGGGGWRWRWRWQRRGRPHRRPAAGAGPGGADP
jgi:polysaccharide biosynthesis transport protein